jgi:hypothetical protein
MLCVMLLLIAFMMLVDFCWAIYLFFCVAAVFFGAKA